MGNAAILAINWGTEHSWEIVYTGDNSHDQALNKAATYRTGQTAVFLRTGDTWQMPDLPTNTQKAKPGLVDADFLNQVVSGAAGIKSYRLIYRDADGGRHREEYSEQQEAQDRREKLNAVGTIAVVRAIP